MKSITVNKKVRVSFIYSSVTIILLLWGCTPKVAGPKDYVNFIKNPKNGLCPEKIIRDYTFRFQYLPIEYAALREQDLEQLDYTKYEQDKKSMQGLIHVNFYIQAENESVLKKDVKSEEEIYERIEYFSYRVQKDFYLLYGDDTLKCLICHFERTYELSPYLTFILGFEDRISNQKNYQDLTLVYKDNLLGTGPVRIAIKGKFLRKIPELKI
jgi:hypothetical protein